MSSNLRNVGALAASSLLVLTLGACSSQQSVDEACGIVSDTLSEVEDSSNLMMQEALTGDGDIADYMEPLSDSLDKAEGKVTNPEVAEALKEFNGQFTELTNTIVEIGGLNLNDLESEGPEIMEKYAAEFESIEKDSAAMEESAMKIQELCGDI